MKFPNSGEDLESWLILFSSMILASWVVSYTYIAKVLPSLIVWMWPVRVWHISLGLVRQNEPTASKNCFCILCELIVGFDHSSMLNRAVTTRFVATPPKILLRLFICA